MLSYAGIILFRYEGPGFLPISAFSAPSQNNINFKLNYSLFVIGVKTLCVKSHTNIHNLQNFVLHNESKICRVAQKHSNTMPSL